MPKPDAAAILEAILIEENRALERQDAAAAAALLQRKLAATDALATADVALEQAERLRHLAAENRRLLEQAIEVQSRIITMVAQAVQETTKHSRYGAAGRTLRSDSGFGIARQA